MMFSISRCTFAAVLSLLLVSTTFIPLSRAQSFPQCAKALSTDCKNKLCTYQYYFYTCEAFKVQFNPTCAQYILGYIYSCPIFPAPSELVNAPSICLNELASFSARTTPALVAYLQGNFSTYCQIPCFQSFLTAAVDLYASSTNGGCYSEITAAKTVCPISAAVSGFQELRGTECAINSKSHNCFDITKKTLGGAATPSFPPSIPTTNIDYTCKNLNQGRAVAGAQTVIAKTCSSFASTGCCTANSQTLQLQQTFEQFSPPCLTRFLSVNCKGSPFSYNLSNFCNNGSILDVSVVRGVVYMKQVSPLLPNMQNNKSTSQFLSVLGTLLSPPLATQQMTINNYTYYNSSGLPSTSNDGFPSVGNADYLTAVAGSFFFQATISSDAFSQNNVSTNQELIDGYVKQINDGTLAAKLKNSSYAPTEAYSNSTFAGLFPAKPFYLPETSAASAQVRGVGLGVVMISVLSLSIHLLGFL